MSYEGRMLVEAAMPTRNEVEQALLRILFKHGGIIKDFRIGEQIVAEIANEFHLSEHQRTVALETVYRKENRLKKSLLWHRLLFRAADSLAKGGYVSRPSETLQLTKKREWMLTEKGFDKALQLCDIPASEKECLATKSFEVQKIVKVLAESSAPINYDPFDQTKKITKTTRESALRSRGFRQAVIEAYDCTCAVCGLKIQSPDSLYWEVEAAHIVPNRSLGRDDIPNGLALCHLHHWAFDVGWFTLRDDYKVQVSPKMESLTDEFGKLGDYSFLQALIKKTTRIRLPKRNQIYPHTKAMSWHRENIYHKV